MSDEKKLVLFSCPQMAELAEGVRDAMTAHGRIELGNVRWEHFSDGWPKNFIEDATTTLEGREVAFLASFDTPAEVFRQLSVIYALARYSARQLTLVLPFFPVGTQDRVERLGDIVTAKTLSRMLESIPSGLLKTTVIIYDIHTMQESMYVSDNVLVKPKSAMRLMRRRLREKQAEGAVAVVFPDDGARKRFKYEFEGIEHIVCEKRKKDLERIITIIEGDPTGKYCLIVDDTLLTGGTILSCAEVITKAGAFETDVFVPNAPCPDDSWKRFLDPEYIDRTYITDSCPTTVGKIPCDTRLHVLSLNELIAEDLLK